MKNPELCTSFQKYLASIFADENWSFYVCANRFTRLLCEDAEAITEVYLRDNSLHQLHTKLEEKDQRLALTNEMLLPDIQEKLAFHLEEFKEGSLTKEQIAPNLFGNVLRLVMEELSQIWLPVYEQQTKQLLEPVQLSFGQESSLSHELAAFYSSICKFEDTGIFPEIDDDFSSGSDDEHEYYANLLQAAKTESEANVIPQSEVRKMQDHMENVLQALEKKIKELENAH